MGGPCSVPKKQKKSAGRARGFIRKVVPSQGRVSSVQAKRIYRKNKTTVGKKREKNRKR